MVSSGGMVLALLCIIPLLIFKSLYPFYEYERCRKCNAKRVVQYPPGMTLDSDPKPVPKYCPVILDI